MEKKIEEFKYRSEEITWKATRKNKELQNIKGKLNMMYIMGRSCMLIDISGGESGDDDKEAES